MWLLYAGELLVFLAEGRVRSDGVAAVGTNGKEEGAGHVAVGEADASVEVEFPLLGMVEAQAIHDAELLEVFRELRLEVCLGEATIEELLAVLHDEELEAVVFELHSILVNHLGQLLVGLAGDSIDNLMAALHQGVGIGIVGQTTNPVACLFRLICFLFLNLLRSARCKENQRIRK